MTDKLDPVALAQALVRCPSVTPHEGGALEQIEGWLDDAGFQVHRVTFSDADTPDVENLYARIGSGAPALCFAGHTDVVPPGNEAAWTHRPFSGEITGGVHGTNRLMGNSLLDTVVFGRTAGREAAAAAR